MPLTSTTTPRLEEFAAIDLGSNSVYMVVCTRSQRRHANDCRLKQRGHLDDGLDDDPCLRDEAMERGLACLALFAERLQGLAAAGDEHPHLCFE